MENTIEQQVLSMITANPGITTRQIHALRPAIKPVHSAIRSLLRKGKLRKDDSEGQRSTKY